MGNMVECAQTLKSMNNSEQKIRGQKNKPSAEDTIDGNQNIEQQQDKLPVKKAKVLKISIGPWEEDQTIQWERIKSKRFNNLSKINKQNQLDNVWLSIFTEITQNPSQNKQSKNQALSVSKYQNYFFSFLPKYKEIVIREENFFKIREIPVTKFYRMGEKIGEGAFGSVYLAQQHKTGQKRAIKIMKMNIMSTQDVETLTNEVNILKQMDHINIIKIYDIFSYQGFFYVITEYCAGGNLTQFLQKGKNISNENIRSIMKQIISAIYYINSKSIVHRDMKLDNLVIVDEVTESNKNEICIKIIDFGLAKKVQKSKKKSELVGTPSYMAPEILRRKFSMNSDIWSCGIIFSILLIGINPFKAKYQEDTFRNILKKKIDFKNLKLYEKVDELALDLLINMLERNCVKRFTSQECLNHPYIKNINIKEIQALMNKHDVIKNIRNFSKGNNFTCFIKNFIISKKSTQAQRQQMALIFSKIDTDASGQIDIEELAKLYQISTGMDSQEAQKLIKKIDQNNSNKIDFHQFMMVMTKNDILLNKNFLFEAFDFIDQDHTGSISKEELIECMGGCDEEEIISLMEDIDCNGDGQISQTQFCKYMQSINF